MPNSNNFNLRGYYGGTFDPIHQGHLQLALYVQNYCQLSQLDLLPCHIPPHRAAPGSSSAHRAAMVRLAVAEHPALVINELELNKNQPSFTVDTLRTLKQQHPDDALCFLLGMDSLCSFKSWHQYAEILTLAHLIVLQRPGYDAITGDAPSLLASYQAKDILELRRNSAGKILVLDNPTYNISASQIRGQYQQNQLDPSLQIPAVQQYIEQHQLYR
ncbi:MAG: nicotinate-nucleotide adenylyltransferase [Gammaproteobacteria bacterium]|jgi:nicotinate-nucleotide adenylyltransferase|nr:nicotinate-nucleotide adenylyltransferase [Gammaproteobacteria bacterium]